MHTADAAPSASGTQPPHGRYLSFEGLRGIMALLVCVGHIGLNTVAGRFGLHVRFEMAVDVFFALSGFVMSQAYYFRRRTFRRLAWGRVARLYPLHLLTLIWVVVVFGLSGHAIDQVILGQNALLVHNLGLPPNQWSFNFPSWSISVEMAVSLLFWFVIRKNTVPAGLALAVTGLVLGAHEIAAQMPPVLNELTVLNAGLLRGIAGFSIGCGAYMLSTQYAKAIARFAPATLPLLLLLGATFFIVQWTFPLGLLFAATLLAVLMLCAVNDRSTFLSWRPLVWLGGISYAVYLLHIPLLMTAQYLLSDGFVRESTKVALLAAILLLAALCHRGFELPMQARILAMMRTRQPAADDRKA